MKLTSIVDCVIVSAGAEFDTSDSRSSVGQSPAATAEGASSSSGVSSASILKIIKKIPNQKENAQFLNLIILL